MAGACQAFLYISNSDTELTGQVVADLQGYDPVLAHLVDWGHLGVCVYGHGLPHLLPPHYHQVSVHAAVFWQNWRLGLTGVIVPCASDDILPNECAVIGSPQTAYAYFPLRSDVFHSAVAADDTVTFDQSEEQASVTWRAVQAALLSAIPFGSASIGMVVRD